MPEERKAALRKIASYLPRGYCLPCGTFHESAPIKPKVIGEEMLTEEQALAWATQLDDAAIAQRAITEADEAACRADVIYSIARHAYESKRGSENTAALFNAEVDSRRARDHLAELQRLERDKFARARGWRVSSRNIYTAQLLAGTLSRGGYRDDCAIEHRESFVGWRDDSPRTPQACRYPKAILSHTHDTWESCVHSAEKCGLSVERLPYSWYWPGGCIAALFTRRGE